MEEEVKSLKNALRIIDCKYVSSKITDEEILIRLTNKKRNYILHINNNYGLVTLEQIESLNVGNIGYDDFALLNDLREILPYTEFEGYNAYIVSYLKTFGYVKDTPAMVRKMEVSIDTGNEDITVFKAIIEPSKEIDGKIIDYFGELYSFDNRIFEEDWLEDFNEKVSTYSEKDLFLIISTIASYPYKVLTDSWKGEKIDPYVLDYASEVAVEEVKKHIDEYFTIDVEDKFSDWYHMWELYFTDKTLEEYLKSKEQKRKKKDKS